MKSLKASIFMNKWTTKKPSKFVTELIENYWNSIKSIIISLSTADPKQLNILTINKIIQQLMH